MDKFVLQIALTFKKSVQKYKSGFQFPKSSDITKTYHYRWFSSFVKECRKQGYNDEEMHEIVKMIVKYAYDNKLLKIGAALLSRSDIIDICINQLKEQTTKIDSILFSLKKSNDFINNATNDRYNYFIKKKSKYSLYNLTDLRNNHIIDDNFICCSQAAIKAIPKVDDIDLSLKDLTLRRYKIINHVGIEELRNIFGSDLIHV